MRPTIGLPQALVYHKYFPLWGEFFSYLGADVAVSGPTDKRVLNAGLEAADSELCLPVKLFFGHVLELAQQVDFVFVPRIVAVEGDAFTCPKLLGLPDMIGALGERAPSLLSETFNMKRGMRDFYKSVYKVGSVCTDSSIKVYRAWRSGLRAQADYERQLLGGVTPLDVLGQGIPEKEPDLTIGVVGHAYNVYDRHLSMDLINRLRKSGGRVVTGEMLPPKVIERELQRLPKRLFWSYEKEVVGSAFHFIHTGDVDGIIFLLSFACGPDSLTQVLIEHEARKTSKTPMMSLVVDEHSGEAGMATRVEAFVDMLRWQKGRVC